MITTLLHQCHQVDLAGRGQQVMIDLKAMLDSVSGNEMHLAGKHS